MKKMFDIMDKKFLFKEYSFEVSHMIKQTVLKIYQHIKKLKFVSFNKSYEHNLKPVKLI